MKTVCAFLLGLIALCAADSRESSTYGQFPYGPVGAYPYGAYPYGYGYGYNNEFTYRQRAGFPVHVGGGNFYYLGAYAGTCGARHGFYYTGDENSFVLCSNGVPYKFDCPKGTKNKDASSLKTNIAYSRSELCSVHTSH